MPPIARGQTWLFRPLPVSTVPNTGRNQSDSGYRGLDEEESENWSMGMYLFSKTLVCHLQTKNYRSCCSSDFATNNKTCFSVFTIKSSYAKLTISTYNINIKYPNYTLMPCLIEQSVCQKVTLGRKDGCNKCGYDEYVIEEVVTANENYTQLETSAFAIQKT